MYIYPYDNSAANGATTKLIHAVLNIAFDVTQEMLSRVETSTPCSIKTLPALVTEDNLRMCDPAS